MPVQHHNMEGRIQDKKMWPPHDAESHNLYPTCRKPSHSNPFQQICYLRKHRISRERFVCHGIRRGILITRDKTVKRTVLVTATGFERHGRALRKAEFLARMADLIPRSEPCAQIEPHYPKAGNGQPPVGLERMPGCIV